MVLCNTQAEIHMNTRPRRIFESLLLILSDLRPVLHQSSAQGVDATKSVTCRAEDMIHQLACGPLSEVEGRCVDQVGSKYFL